MFDLSAALLPENAIRVDEVVSFSVPPSSSKPPPALAATDPIPLSLTLSSGQQLCKIDHIILCTGYHLTLPFLPHLHSDFTPAEHASGEVLVTDGTMFHNLHRDIFYIPDPSLAFVGVPFFTATFTLFEFQAMVVAKVFAGLAHLPSESSMRGEYGERVRVKGTGKGFHSLKDREEEYVGGLLGWVNGELEAKGRGVLEGYTERWRGARGEMVERVRKLLAVERGVGRGVEVFCLGGGEGEGGLVRAAA